MAELDRLFVRVEGDIRGLRRDLEKIAGIAEQSARRTNKGFKDVNKTLGNTGRIASGVRGELIRMATSIASVTAVVQGFKAAVGAFSDFQVGLTKIGKTANIEGEELTQLGQNIQKISREVPVAISELLEIGEAAGQVGVEGSQDILKFTETIGKLGLASNLAGGEAATALVRILKATNTPLGEVDKLASVIVRLGNNFAASESEIAFMTQQVANASGQFNVTAADAAAIGTAMKAMGIAAENAGTQTGSAFIVFRQAIDAGGSELKKMADLVGVTADEFKKLFFNDPAALINKFVQALGKVQRENKSVPQLLEDIGLAGDRAIKVFGPLSKNPEEFAKALEMASDEMEKNTALTEEAIKASSTFSAQMTLVGNAVNEAAVEIGREFAPAISSALGSFKAFLLEAKDTGKLKAFAEAAAVGFKALGTAIKFAAAAGALFAANRLAGVISSLGARAIAVGSSFSVMNVQNQRLARRLTSVSGKSALAARGLVAYARAGRLAGIAMAALGGPIGILISLLGLLGLAAINNGNIFLSETEKFTKGATKAYQKMAEELGADEALRPFVNNTKTVIEELKRRRAGIEREIEETIKATKNQAQGDLFGFGGLEKNTKNVTKLRAEVEALTVKIKAFEDIAEKKGKAADKFEAAQKEAAKLKKEMDDLLDQLGEAGENEGLEELKGKFEALRDSLDPVGAAFRQLKEDTDTLKAAQDQLADSTGLTEAAWRRLFDTLDARKIIDVTNAMKDFVDTFGDGAVESDAFRQVQEQLFEQARAGVITWDFYRTVMEDLERRLRGAAAGSGELGKKTGELAGEAKIAANVAKDLGLAFTSAFEDAIVKGTGLREILQGLEEDILRLLARRLITEPLLEGIDKGISGVLSGGKEGGEDGEGGGDNSIDGGGIGDMIAAGILSARGAFQELIGDGKTLFKDFGTWVTDLFSNLDLSGLFEGIGSFFSGIFGSFSLPSFGFGFKDGGEARGSRTAARRFALGGEATPKGGKVLFAATGAISGPGGPRSDKIPAMVSNGEFIVNAESTKRNKRLLMAVNDNPSTDFSKAAGFASGGIAGGIFTSPILDAGGSNVMKGPGEKRETNQGDTNVTVVQNFNAPQNPRDFGRSGQQMAKQVARIVEAQRR